MRTKAIRATIILGVLLAVVASIYLVSQRNVRKSDKTSGSTDSIYVAMDKLPVGKYEIAMAREQVTAYYSGNLQLYRQLTRYFEKRADNEDNKVAWSYIKSNKASILLTENKPDSALIMAYEAEKEIPDGSNSVVLGNIYNTIANAHYYLGHQDSAKIYMTKGYVFATTKKIDAFISTFGINLGTYYYNHLLLGAASYYFNAALEASKRIGNTPLMLINNITSILSAEHKYKEADSLWNIYLPEMEKVGDPYERQLYFLNRTLHLQTMGRWKEARKIYSQYKTDEIYDVMRVSYLRALLNQAMKENPAEAMSLVRKHRDWIGERYVPAVSELFNLLHDMINEQPSLIPMDSILRWERNFATDLVNDPKAAAHSNQLKSLIALKNGNTVLAYQFLEKSRLNDVAFEGINDSLRFADFAEKNQLSKLKEDISIAKLKLEKGQLEKTYGNYLWVLSICVLISFIIALLSALSYRKTKLEFALEQINSIKNEESHILKEQELNSRIVNLSQLIVIKAQDLGKKIKLISSEDKETLHEVKREIDELSRLGIEDKPQLADKLIDDHQAIFDRFPEFSETANLTEKRIFILSIDGYKPKEISNVVGVSVQYVHNVRTRLRKKLNLDNNMEWESLKKSWQVEKQETPLENQR